MKLITAIICAASLFAGAVAAEAQPNCKLRPDQVLKLYPEGQAAGKGLPETQGPVTSNGNTAEMESIAENGNISYMGDNARMELYFPKKPNGQMVIVCPGGGYWITSSWNEGLYVADWMLARGITVCVVEYRMPNGHWEIPLQDIQNAFRYCRAHAGEWGVNQIGVMGFSAGGHLAATASNLWTDSVTRPDFSILIYPVITLNPGTTHHGTHKFLLGEKRMVQERYMDKYSMEKQAGRQTPPTFLALCSDDATVPAENSLMYYNRLIEMEVPVEMHIWSTGGHGWGFTSEKFAGEGKDKFAYGREEFYSSLARWLKNLR